jgi:phospholipid transport system substrate-binding protein
MFFLLNPYPLWAGVVTDQIRETVEKIVAILQDSSLKPETRKAERRARLRQIINARFDIEEMARRSLGSHWQSRTPGQQSEFVKLFSALLEDSYLDRIESYSGDTILYLRESEDGEFSEVSTKVVPKKGDELAINYKLHAANKQWKIYDVVIENISLVNNYRAQFNRILATASFEELLKKLREKKGKEFSAERSLLSIIGSYAILSAGFLARPR